MFGKTVRSLLLSLGLVSGAAHATLYDRGSGLIYDDVLNITWLQDANYAKTSGYDTDGRMTWGAALEWARQLSYYDNVRGVRYGDWRLPSTGGYGPFPSINGCMVSGEMSHLFWSDGSLNCGLPITMSLELTDKFDNLQAATYWTSQEDFPSWYQTSLAFSTYRGTLQSTSQSSELFAWAVRDGDVGPAPNNVPEPSALALALLGLFGAASLAANRKQVPRTQPALAR